MRIGELARIAGLNVQTIRFYERRGLLRKPLRTGSGQRRYSAGDVELLQTISQAKRLGFTLREIRRILSLWAVPDEGTGKTRYARGSHACLEEIAAIGSRKLAALDEQVRALQATRKELQRALKTIRKAAAARRPLSRTTRESSLRS